MEFVIRDLEKVIYPYANQFFLLRFRYYGVSFRILQSNYRYLHPKKSTINMRKILILLITIFIASAIYANDGYSIKVKLENFSQDTLYLGYHYADKQYLLDTATVSTDGFFVFEGEEALAGGVYLVVMPPKNEYFQILVTEGEQHFTVVADSQNPVKHTTIEGSEDNKLLYDYLRFISARRPAADSLRQLENQATSVEEKAKYEEQRNAINLEVETYQQDVVEKHPKTLTAAIIRANVPMQQPEFTGTEEEVQMQRWQYSLKHFFDNVDLGDPRMLRTPFLFERVDYYINRLNAQHPDTLIRAVDDVLEQMKPAEETFKFFLIHFLNNFAKSQYVGMDKVYVHLVNEYYAKGLAPWTEEDQLEKIIENAKGIEPTLIGKVAPNIEMTKRDGSKIALHDVDSKYTVLYIWKYDCGVCQKATPVMKEFYENFKDEGVEIFAVCFKFGKDVSPCWEYVDEKGIQDWIHTVDPYNRSKYRDLYYVKSTPQIYILDENKEILSKRIGAEQLGDVMTRILEMEAKEANSGTGK